MPDLDEMIEQARGLFSQTRAAARPWFEFTAKADEPSKVTLRIYDEISWWGTDARTFVEHLDEITADEIDLRLNSPGGNAWDGLAIMNALRAHPAKVTTTVDGMAASAASLIAMAGDRVRMNRGSVMMVHDASGLAYGNPKTMEKTKQVLDLLSDSYADVYAARAGGTRAEWREVMGEETWYKAQEAVDAGLADDLADDDPPEPTASATARFDLSRFAYAYAGRDAAPPPKIPHPKTSAPEQTPGASSCPPQSAAEAMRQIHAAATKTTHASPAGGDKKGATQVDLAKLREALGLAQDVSDDEVTASALAALQPPAAPPAETPPVPAATASKPGTMTLDVTAWDEQQDRIKRLEAQAAKQSRDERDKVIAEAVTDGKFAPARKEHWARLWDADPEGTREVIDSLAKNVVPVAALGYATDAVNDDFDREFASLFPPVGKGV